MHHRAKPGVSVLFSEPKIPQSIAGYCASAAAQRFQCSSASRKFLNGIKWIWNYTARKVSVLFSEPKIPQSDRDARRSGRAAVSVLFSEPKIPQSAAVYEAVPARGFQCSSASRKFLNLFPFYHLRHTRLMFQCSSASRKFLN